MTEENVHELLRQYVAQLPGLGIDRLYLDAGSIERALRPKPHAQQSDATENRATLAAMAQDMEDCQRCGLCQQGRSQVVFGDGNPDARLVFVGEAPGAEEDRKGIPFVGRAGQLLTRMIEAMGVKREDVYICNVIKCRPPENRDPLPDEIATCEPFMIRQLEVIAPEVIVCLGRFAVQTLTRDPMARITKIRGTWHEYQGIPLMPTFHPSYLLRNPSAKRDVWQDLQQVMQRLDIPVPSES